MKKLILSALCATAALGAFAQKTAQPDDKKALARYIWDNQWVPCSANLDTEKEILAVSFSETGIGYSDGCNSCGDEIRFEVSKSRFRWFNDNYGPVCTELDCLDDTYRDGLHGLGGREYIGYRRAGEQVIFTVNKKDICLKPMPK